MIAAAAANAYRLAGDVAAAVAGQATRHGAIPERWRGVGDRLGDLPADARRMLLKGPVLWIHAASVGELRGVRPLVAALRTRRAGRVMLATTLTRTGLALARELPEIDVATLLPLDAVRPIGRLLDGVGVEALLFTETEDLAHTAGRAGAARGPGVHGERPGEPRAPRAARRGGPALRPGAAAGDVLHADGGRRGADRRARRRAGPGPRDRESQVRVGGGRAARERPAIRVLARRPPAAGRRQHARRRGRGAARRPSPAVRA